RGRGGGWAAWGVEAQVGVAGQFGGASAGAFGQVTFGQRLQAPGDAFDKPGAVAGRRGLAEQFGEALPQLADSQAVERRDLVEDVQFHRVFSFRGVWKRSTRVDSEPRFATKRKAIRAKKGRFFERKGGPEMVVPAVESASGAAQERPAYSERVTGVR